MCLALRDLYSGLAIMIRMPQSKPCEFLQWQVKEREREKREKHPPSLSLPPSSSLSHSHIHTQEIWIKYSWSGLRFSYTHMLPHSSSLQWTEASIQLVWHSRVWQRAWQHPSATYHHHCCCRDNHQIGHSKHALLSSSPLFSPFVLIALRCTPPLPLSVNNLLWGRWVLLAPWFTGQESL